VLYVDTELRSSGWLCPQSRNCGNE
jgi:hypothetical protein